MQALGPLHFHRPPVGTDEGAAAVMDMDPEGLERGAQDERMAADVANDGHASVHAPRLVFTATRCGRDGRAAACESPQYQCEGRNRGRDEE